MLMACCWQYKDYDSEVFLLIQPCFYYYQFSLPLVIFYVLQSVFSDINTVTFSCCLLSLALHLLVSFYLM